MDAARAPLAAALLGICLAVPAAAQSGAHAPAGRDAGGDPRAYGVTSWTVNRIGSAEFVSEDSGTGYAFYGNSLYSTSPNGYFRASAHVPSGAFLEFFYLDYCAFVIGGDVWAWLWSCDQDDPGSCQQLAFVSSTPQSVCTVAYQDLSPKNYTVDNNTKDLYAEVVTKGGYLDSAFTGVRIYYQLQMSPAPATATFNDVPTSHTYFRAIEALAKAGITNGCGSGNFCPNQALTRGEMAKFLAVALGLDWHP